ncbi:mitochondrial carrier [Nadsonia fulvescens var. elongata DSM 6958]|uniref:Mitochondrial carrier n=1 Tax=Nadsonia fulvescens var. elongata DSM 6958 TaxID=857566 RepID=A0A1E3PCR6_9ASCO|nr:mitochondrial carrier [Nadsonia fulvescens var. elongata DSM 6958]
MDQDTIAASVMSSVCSRLVLHPLDTLRTLQQTSTNSSYILPFRSYWRGLGASLALTTPAFTLYMVSYRQCKKELTPYFGSDGMLNYVVSGAMAELVSSFGWTPMEVIKGRMQISGGQAVNKSTIDMCRYIYKNEGYKGFFRGYWMGIAVFLPHSVVWWVTYEEIKAAFKRVEKKEELSTWQYALSSAVSTTTAMIASNFLDVVKTRQQLAVSDEIASLRPDDQKSVIKVAKNLIKEAGFFQAMFKGLSVRLMHGLPSGVFCLVLFEKLNNGFSKKTAGAILGNEEEAALEFQDV